MPRPYPAPGLLPEQTGAQHLRRPLAGRRECKILPSIPAGALVAARCLLVAPAS